MTFIGSQSRRRCNLRLWRPLALASLLSTSVLASVAQAQSMDFSVMAGSRIAGTMSVREERGERIATFQYDDRGSGPRLTERVRSDGRGVPASVVIDGLDYSKADANEQFSCTNDVAKWTSPVDSGSGRCAGFYLNNAQLPEDAAMMARALLKAPGNLLKVLPQGEMRLQRLQTEQVQRQGTTVEVTLYAVHGIGLLPVFVWLDPDYELFLTNYADSPVVRRGWEAEVPDLLAKQDGATRTLLSAATEQARTKPSGPLLIRNVNLFDARRRVNRPGMSVLVRGDRIEAVGRGLRAPVGAKVIDGSGQSLLPGLWDMHTHLSNLSQGFLDLGDGITSARDMGNSIEKLSRYARWFSDGTIAGPRVFKVGLIDGRGPFSAPIDTLASTPAEMEEVINRYVGLGYEQIKLYNSVKPELVPIAIAAAHQHGRRISGHVPAGMTADELVDDGFDELQHMNFLILNFYPNDSNKTASAARFTVIGDKAGSLDLDSQPVASFIANLKRHDIVIDPTMALFEGLYDPQASKTPAMAAVLDQLPAAYRRKNVDNGLAHDPAAAIRYRAAWETMRHMLLRLYAAGVRMVPGTDGLSGFTYQRELEIWSQSGIKNADILYAATLGAASVNSHQNELGSIEPGKLADMILVRGDPLARISDIRNVTLTIKNGELYDPTILQKAINLSPLRPPSERRSVNGAG